MHIPTPRFKMRVPNVSTGHIANREKRRPENQEISLLGECLKFSRVYIILSIPAQDLKDFSREAERTLM